MRPRRNNMYFSISQGSASGLEAVDTRCYVLWDLHLFFHRVCMGWSIQDLGEFDSPCSLLLLHSLDEIQFEVNGENGAMQVGCETNLRLNKIVCFIYISAVNQ